MLTRLFLAVALITAASACKHNKRANTTVRHRAEFDMSCPRDDLRLIVLDTEDAERPMPPNMEEDINTYNKLKKEDPQKAMAFIVEWMKTPEAQEAFGHAARVEFPEEQRAWFKKVLAENADVRWTFVFLHEPVWDNPSESFKEMNEAIQGRDCTFFAGHTHYYDYDVLNDGEYITVASAGAAFVHDGPGNVDMLTLVTMTEFGRTSKENGSLGTDHGVAAPVLLVSGGLRGGVHGRHPSLDDLEGVSDSDIARLRDSIRDRLDKADAYSELYADRLDSQMDDALGRAEVDLQLEERKRRLGLSEAPPAVEEEAEEEAASSVE